MLFFMSVHAIARTGGGIKTQVPSLANELSVRENLWLADPDTREHYQHLLEFVELWDRWLAKSIPAEVIERLEHSEENLKPFYEHLKGRHDLLRTKIEQGKA